MAKTYTLSALGTTVGAVAANKAMAYILNSSANVVRVYKVVALNTQSATVTGIATILSLQKITAVTTPTAIAPNDHDSADTSFNLTTITSGSAVSVTRVGSPGDTFVQMYWSTDEATAQASVLDNDYLECFVPLGIIWDCTGDTNVEPITLRTGQGLALVSSAGAAGLLDAMITFTVGA